MIKNGTQVTVLGAARSGIAAAKLLKQLNAVPFVSDISNEEKLIDAANLLQKEGIKYEFGKHSDKVYDSEMVIISPGVPTNSEIVKQIKAKNIRIVSELEFASSVCKATLIAITGTNGKTTTTSLMSHVLKSCKKSSYTAGNIGLALSELTAEINEDEFVALEVSSFQLDFIEKFKPKISMILNITPDHLNRYDNDFGKYAASKLKIFSNQDVNDWLIVNADDENLSVVNEIKSPKVFKFSLQNEVMNGAYLRNSEIIYKENGIEEFKCSINDIFLRGEHNYANVMAVVIAAKLLGCENEEILLGLKSFKGVEHRLEFVRNVEGVSFINDSKATNVDSVWYALRSFDQPIFLILGGQDKGNDYSKIENLVVDKVKKIYAIGSSADTVFKYFHKKVKVEIKYSLEECVLTANKETNHGDIVLLSPACASFDMFKNYEHRGEVFKKAVEAL
ncbi:MAG: UDP-N-acetylmuramoyl-L-alanine--D-glutamate ligase [Ignavibacteria bacterium]|nr:UDP-N-acetylmuramoyl-L-alanine--D-glutamate ligase [Ignavibacteria bacterium]